MIVCSRATPITEGTIKNRKQAKTNKQKSSYILCSFSFRSYSPKKCGKKYQKLETFPDKSIPEKITYAVTFA